MKTIPTIFYDARCGLCSAGRRWFGRILLRRGWQVVPLDDPGVAELFGFTPGQTPGENKVRTADGRLLGGLDAYGYIWAHVWWSMPLSWLTRVPIVRPLMRRVYQTVAEKRHVISAACRLRPDRDR